MLDEGRFWGVGLEVTSPEPLPSEDPLWDQPRVIITPHAAGNSFGPDSPLVKKIWKFIIPNLCRFLRGEGIACGMGRDYHPGLLPQRMILRQRFRLGHLQANAPEMALIQQTAQPLLIDETAPAAVDQHRVLLHFAQPLLR